MKHATANQDRQLFERQHNPQLPSTFHRWVEDPEGDYDPDFGRMTLKEFRQWKSRAESRCMESQGVRPSKKRCVEDDIEEDEQLDQRRRAKGKGKAAVSRYYDSDDLDG